MPTITNVRLNFLNTESEEWKTVRVSYTVSFNTLEISAGVIFQADSWVRSYDGNLDPDRNINVRDEQWVERNYIRASSEAVSMRDSTIIRTSRLNEDPDIEIKGLQIPPPPPPPPEIVNIKDEWFARVALSPVTFRNAVAESPVVTGSWGPGSTL